MRLVGLIVVSTICWLVALDSSLTLLFRLFG
jgi:hypothetical protein